MFWPYETHHEHHVEYNLYTTTVVGYSAQMLVYREKRVIFTTAFGDLYQTEFTSPEGAIRSY